MQDRNSSINGSAGPISGCEENGELYIGVVAKRQSQVSAHLS